MFNGGFPVRVGMGVFKMVMVMAAVLFQYASCHNRLAVHGICTGYIQSNRVKGSKHAHIRNNGDIVFRMAVAVRGYIHDQADVEIRPVSKNCLGVFCYFAVQDVIGLIKICLNGIHRTDSYAAAAAYTSVMVNGGLLILERDCAVSTVLFTGMAADTGFFAYMRLSGVMHLHLSRP